MPGSPQPEVGPDRQVQRAALGRRARPQLGRRRQFTCPTRTCSSSTPRQSAAPAPRRQLALPGVGTVLFNMVVNPVSGKVYVTNTEARNEVRFEGPGDLRRDHSCAATCREPHHRARPGDGVASAAPQQAHRLRHLLRPAPERRERAQPRAPAGHGDQRRRRRRSTSRRSARQDRRLRHRGARDRTRSAERARTRSPSAAAARPAGARRAAQPPLRADALRQRASRSSTRHAARDRAPALYNPEPASS